MAITGGNFIPANSTTGNRQKHRLPRHSRESGNLLLSMRRFRGNDEKGENAKKGKKMKKMSKMFDRADIVCIIAGVMPMMKKTDMHKHMFSITRRTAHGARRTA
ncbi:MAG: hypothetical protein ACR2P4_04270 [Gammaproteobacteria bacterium]